MPLKFRETGLVLSPHEIRKDCTACSGEWAVGYIYREAPEEGGGEPRTWFWSLHGVSGKPADIAATAPRPRWKPRKRIWKRTGRNGSDGRASKK
jgi:hypothetical protein